MSIARAHGYDPLEWDMADRMRKALRVSELGVQEIAESLEVSRNAVSAWINGRNTPRDRDVKMFAMRTGVDYDWLRFGASVHPPGLEPGTHCFAHGVCIYCGERDDPTYLAPVTRLPQRATVPATPPTSPEGGGALRPEQSAAA
jgi:transcriptional regulator with XRE-family HTH domain